MSTPLVSILIPAYNAQGFIERTIQSALRQTYKNIEVIVLDDGSADKTAEVVKGLQKNDSRLQYHFQQNQGLSASRNRLVELCKGEYVTFLDHDDELLPEKTQMQLNLFDGDRNMALVYGNVINKYENGKEEPAFKARMPKRGMIFYDYLLGGNFIPLPSVLVRKEALKKYLPFNLEYKVGEEWDLFLRLVKDCKVDYLDNIVGIYHVHQGSFTIKHPFRAVEEWLAIMDYWYNTDLTLRTKFRRQFAREKAKVNLQKTYLFHSCGNYKSERRELVRTIQIDPSWLKLYLKFLAGFALATRRNNGQHG